MRAAWHRQQLYYIAYQWDIVLGLHAYCFQSRVLYLVGDGCAIPKPSPFPF